MRYASRAAALILLIIAWSVPIPATAQDTAASAPAILTPAQMEASLPNEHAALLESRFRGVLRASGDARDSVGGDKERARRTITLRLVSAVEMELTS